MDRDQRQYEEVAAPDTAGTLTVLGKLLEGYLDEYNLSATSPLNLVFFRCGVMNGTDCDHGSGGGPPPGVKTSDAE